MRYKFSYADQTIIRSLLRKLPCKYRKAIILRFWHEYSISDIAKILRITWVEADFVIEKALIELKTNCLKQPNFSRLLSLRSA